MGCSGCLCEERLGPTHTPQGTAEPLSCDGGILGGGNAPWQVLAAARGEPMLEQKHEEEAAAAARNLHPPYGNPHTTTTPLSLVASLNGPSVTCSDSEGGGEESGVKEWSFTGIFLLFSPLSAPLLWDRASE